jgi:hypothetical protein
MMKVYAPLMEIIGILWNKGPGGPLFQAFLTKKPCLPERERGKL